MFWFNLYQFIKKITTKKNSKFISKTDNIKIINDIQKDKFFQLKLRLDSILFFIKWGLKSLNYLCVIFFQFLKFLIRLDILVRWAISHDLFQNYIFHLLIDFFNLDLVRAFNRHMALS